MTHDEPDDRLPFETARLELARLRIDPATERGAAIDRALRLCASTLEVERVGFWTFSADGQALVCERLYCRSTDEASGGDTLPANQYPSYWQALASRRVIAAHDAARDPLTRELAATYLEPLGITSVLDAPVFQGGALVGVVCHEHVGAARIWRGTEIHFASAVADLLSMVLEQVDRLSAQEQLRQRLSRVVGSNQLGTLEQLARSVAHDFANVVLAVELVATRLATRAALDDLELSRSLRACAEVGGSLVSQLQRFGGRAGSGRRLPVVEVVDRLVPIVRTLTREIAELVVVVEIAPDVEADLPVDQLEQVILNLCLNARDAITSHGTITLRVAATGQHVVIAVADDGAGMAPEITARIWEPYFTTKPRGNGIGLATVKAIVDDAGGTIEVESAPGRGSRFVIRLPRERA